MSQTLKKDRIESVVILKIEYILVVIGWPLLCEKLMKRMVTRKAKIVGMPESIFHTDKIDKHRNDNKSLL